MENFRIYKVKNPWEFNLKNYDEVPQERIEKESMNPRTIAKNSQETPELFGNIVVIPWVPFFFVFFRRKTNSITNDRSCRLFVRYKWFQHSRYRLISIHFLFSIHRLSIIVFKDFYKKMSCYKINSSNWFELPLRVFWFVFFCLKPLP